MIQRGTKLFVLDNSGAKVVKCIKVFKLRYGICGSIINVVIKKNLLRKKIKKGMVCKAVVVQMKSNLMRFDGLTVKFLKNYVVILKKMENVPLGTRILGPVAFELRFFGFLKIVSLASTLI